MSCNGFVGMSVKRHRVLAVGFKPGLFPDSSYFPFPSIFLPLNSTNQIHFNSQPIYKFEPSIHPDSHNLFLYIFFYPYKMPRQRGGARPAARPAAPARPAAQQQTRPASTMAAPPAQTHAAPPATAAQAPSQSPGLFGQMASTAAGVAVGSTVGHVLGAGLTGMFGGSSSDAPAAAAPVAPATTNTYGDVTSGNCAADAKAFTSCLEATNNDMNSCSYYLDQLKACQAMFKSYQS
ncbi:hypothetical protein TWF217_011895 [Orbilia oligospora]|nr:hypothetical protein TWF751_003900 [Orbilia oligospora]KAF3241857.1 hypothetical protein TWF217_011895 [Orbilia oligospora]